MYGKVIDIRPISTVYNSASYEHVIDIIDIFIFPQWMTFFRQPPIYGGTTAADPHIWVISQIWDMVCKSYRQGNVYNMFITFLA
jgi:hypothetical protein